MSIPPIPPTAPPLMSVHDNGPRIAVVARVKIGRKAIKPDWMDWLKIRRTPTIRFAEAWELAVPPEIFERAAPLVDRLASKTMTRSQYNRLRSLIVRVSLETGQSEVADAVLTAIAIQWARCPLRYLWF